jgi:putative colanic acid biosynthesis acetyltransferase WcaF
VNCKVPSFQQHPEKYLFGSPWSLRERCRLLVWNVAWLVFCRWTPKYANQWRLWILKGFGCNLEGKPFVSQSAKIHAPWRLSVHDRACVGPHAEIYNLGQVILRERATIAQYAYLCGGSHDFSRSDLPLITDSIVLGEESFVGAKAIVLLGVSVGAGAIIGAGSVVTADIPPWTIWAGNPAREINRRARLSDPPI